jgi:hypothetical protein
MFLGAQHTGATAADLGAHAQQWYHSVATPRTSADARTANNTAPTALWGEGGAVAAANQVPIVAGTAEMIGGRGGQPARLFNHGAYTTTAPQQPALQTALQKVIAFSGESHKKWEWTWQRDLGANKKNEFRNEVLVTEEVQCFGMARRETAVITVVHGLRKFLGAQVPAAIKGAVFGESAS